MPQVPAFPPASLNFLQQIRGHNNREWFLAHKADYEAHVRQPFQRLLTDLQPAVMAISPQYRSDPRPVGGSMFRIQRDTRFSPDKTPYKIHAAIQLRHAQGRDGHAPGF